MASAFRSGGRRTITMQGSLMEDVVQAHAVAPATDEVDFWPGELDDHLISELLSDDSLLSAGLQAPADVDVDPEYYTAGTAAAPCNSGCNTAVEQPAATVSRYMYSSVYTGPKIKDIEKALALRPSSYPSGHRHRSSSLYLFGASSSTAAERKFTTKVRSCGGKMPADGYKWRKYGQKSIKNNLHPRSYYKCTGSRCGAKRHVEKSTNDPEMLIVTYEGTHLHGPEPLLQHLQSQETAFSGAGGGDVYRTMARSSPASDDGTGAAWVGSCAGRPSRQTCDDEARAGGKLEHRRAGSQKEGARDALTPCATADSFDGSGSFSVLHAGAALPPPCFPFDSRPPATAPCFDFPWSPDDLLSADDLVRLEGN